MHVRQGFSFGGPFVGPRSAEISLPCSPTSTPVDATPPSGAQLTRSDCGGCESKPSTPTLPGISSLINAACAGASPAPQPSRSFDAWHGDHRQYLVSGANDGYHDHHSPNGAPWTPHGMMQHHFSMPPPPPPPPTTSTSGDHFSFPHHQHAAFNWAVHALPPFADNDTTSGSRRGSTGSVASSTYTAITSSSSSSHYASSGGGSVHGDNPAVSPPQAVRILSASSGSTSRITKRGGASRRRASPRFGGRAMPTSVAGTVAATVVSSAVATAAAGKEYTTEQLDFIRYTKVDQKRTWREVAALCNSRWPPMPTFSPRTAAAAAAAVAPALPRTEQGVNGVFYRKNARVPALDETTGLPLVDAEGNVVLACEKVRSQMAAGRLRGLLNTWPERAVAYEWVAASDREAAAATKQLWDEHLARERLRISRARAHRAGGHGQFDGRGRLDELLHALDLVSGLTAAAHSADPRL